MVKTVLSPNLGKKIRYFDRLNSNLYVFSNAFLLEK